MEVNNIIYEVPRIGTKVCLRKTLDATIIGIMIKDNNFVQYECTWWNGNQRFSAWIDSNEIYTVETTKLGKIGFVPIDEIIR